MLPASLAACASYQASDPPAPTADPARVVASELAFAQMARESGTWTAFRHYATRDAVMPSPDIVSAQARLKDQPDPPEAIVWEPDLVWTSCSGEFALSTGPAFYPGGATSRFASIWQRQPNGEYRWVIDQGFDLPADYRKPEAVATHVADCPVPGAIREDPGRPDNHSWGRSADQSFAWKTLLTRDCARTLVVHAFTDGEMREVFRRESAAPQVPPGREPILCDD